MLMMYLAMIDTDEGQSRFEEIYYAYRKQMIYVANEVLQDYGLAEDAVQNAFLGIARHIDHVRGLNDDRTRAYVLTAAKNAALNVSLKEQAILQRQTTLDAVEAMADESTFDTLEQEEAMSRLLAVITGLGAANRDVLLLRYVEEMSFGEIARVMGKTEAAIRQQLSRARRALREGCVREGLALEDQP